MDNISDVIDNNLMQELLSSEPSSLDEHVFIKAIDRINKEYPHINVDIKRDSHCLVFSINSEQALMSMMAGTENKVAFKNKIAKRLEDGQPELSFFTMRRDKPMIIHIQLVNDVFETGSVRLYQDKASTARAFENIRAEQLRLVTEMIARQAPVRSPDAMPFQVKWQDIEVQRGYLGR